MGRHPRRNTGPSPQRWWSLLDPNFLGLAHRLQFRHERRESGPTVKLALARERWTRAAGRLDFGVDRVLGGVEDLAGQRLDRFLIAAKQRAAHAAGFGKLHRKRAGLVDDAELQRLICQVAGLGAEGD